MNMDLLSSNDDSKSETFIPAVLWMTLPSWHRCHPNTTKGMPSALQIRTTRKKTIFHVSNSHHQLSFLLLSTLPSWHRCHLLSTTKPMPAIGIAYYKDDKEEEDFFMF
jgi:hypothetical protein